MSNLELVSRKLSGLNMEMNAIDINEQDTTEATAGATYSNNMNPKRAICYFTMEIALRADMPTYGGGLGVLAGDTLKSAADMGLNLVGITMLWRNGYFKQTIDDEGWQHEENAVWDYKSKLNKLPNYARIKIAGESVRVEVWEYKIVGKYGHTVPVYFLDTNVPENPEHIRDLNQYLYGGDEYTRLCQEIVLGIGGIRILRDLGSSNGQVYHLNEGHASLLALELIRERGYNSYDKVRKNCVFTTHTPVAAGHDEFPYDLLKNTLHPVYLEHLEGIIGTGQSLNLTELSLKLSRYVNGVSQMHGKVASKMFETAEIDAITNGIHLPTWLHPALQNLFNEWAKGWEFDPGMFVHVMKVPNDKLKAAHQVAKDELVDYLNSNYDAGFEKDKLTIGFARRAATYKRADLLFTDLERLTKIAGGKIQLVYSGKAHPRDHNGKELIQRVIQAGKKLGKEIPLVYLEEYNMDTGAMLTSGCDVWLNNPRRPREASGTSGMKAAVNGVLNFSILDGWWIEGYLEGKTGWAIGPNADIADMESYDDSKDVDDLYDKLENEV
ncbi:MAG: alpha-glucan family phosphorylase, partial [Candidatus Marinimicrobia bacterium]|nr:alpha-glucan family phosphorylase [Candidatus Neomarinimicrobiota bacterium]